MTLERGHSGRGVGPGPPAFRNVPVRATGPCSPEARSGWGSTSGFRARGPVGPPRAGAQPAPSGDFLEQSGVAPAVGRGWPWPRRGGPQRPEGPLLYTWSRGAGPRPRVGPTGTVLAPPLGRRRYTVEVDFAPIDPLASLDEDYGSAVLHLTWAIDRKTRTRMLLAAAVELLPTEVPPPEVGGERCEVLSRGYFLYAQDLVVSPRRALAWFEDTERGNSVRPKDDGTLPDASDPNAERFVVSSFSAEPPAPALVVPKAPMPFCADWHVTPRVRHLIADTDPSSVFTAEERKKAASWLAGEVHLDLTEFPEFWGAVHLLAPNPVFRSLRVRPDGEPHNRSGIVVTFIPRTGRSVVGLELLLEEERATGLGILASVTVEGPIARIGVPTNPGSIRERVTDPRRGVLHDGPFGVFDVGFSLTTRLSSSKRKVAPTRAGEAGYEVPLFSSEQVGARVGPAAPDGAGRALRAAALDRTRRANGVQNQRWFRDQAADAAQALRDLIGPATAALLCDPYFGGDDLQRVGLAITDPKVRVRILTSERFLLFRHPTATTEGAHLANRLAEARATTPINPIEVHVMPGDHPAIHDRFLHVGERLWMLGSSINHFGGRGTLMVAVPDPDPVLEDLERVWGESPELSAWAARRAHGGAP